MHVSSRRDYQLSHVLHRRRHLPVGVYYVGLFSGVAKGPGDHGPPMPDKIRMVGNGGPIIGCLIHSVTKYSGF